MVIIHISGASGSGKSYLGNKLLELFGNKIIVKDIDDLRVDFIKKYYGDNEWNVIDKDAYQEYIDKYITEQKKKEKPLIFVGLNTMPWWHKDLYYNFQPDYKFYIDIDTKKLIKQKCMRYLTQELKDIINDEIAMNDLMNNNKKFIRLVCQGIKRECDIKQITDESDKWKNDYESQGYTVLNSDEIYERVVNILNDIVQKGGKKKRKHTKRNKNVKKVKNTRKNIS